MRGAVIMAMAACGGSSMTSPDGAAADSPAMMMSDAAGGPTADQLMGKLASCDKVGGDYAKDDGAAQVISICGLANAVFWQADMDVDCDGKMSAHCNTTTDPDYQDQTAATDSHGDPLDAAALPYVVIPGVSSRFDYRTAGLDMGSVVAVIYNHQLAYAVLGDVGPSSIIGEASYATAAALGIDPDPSTGGADDGVAYIAFTGSDAVVDPIESHDAAVALGTMKAMQLLSQ